MYLLENNFQRKFNNDLVNIVILDSAFMIILLENDKPKSSIYNKSAVDFMYLIVLYQICVLNLKNDLH